MKDVIRDQEGRPICATFTDDGKEYLVSVSDRTQMSQGLLKGYARGLGIRDLPQITCRTMMDESLPKVWKIQRAPRPELNEDQFNEVVMRLANNEAVDRSLYIEERVQASGVKSEVDADNLREVKKFAGEMIRAGKENFVLPMMTQDSRDGSGHTLYMVVTKENGKYRSSIVTQTEPLAPEYIESLSTFTDQISQAITEVSGVAFHAENRVVAGAFKGDENVASCTEIGAPLLNAMMSADPLNNLNNAIRDSVTNGLTLADIGQIRLQGMKCDQAGLGVNGMVADAIDFSKGVGASEEFGAKEAFAIEMDFIRSDIDINNEIRRMGTVSNILAIPIDGKYNEITTYLNQQAGGHLHIPPRRENMPRVEVKVPVIQRPIANKERQERVAQQLNARMDPIQAPQLNAAAMQESIREVLALSKTISEDIGQRADLIKEVFLSQQPIVNGRVQNISQAEASNLVAPIIKDQVLEFIAAGNREDAKLLVHALDVAVAKQTFGEVAFNAINQGRELTEAQKVTIPGFVSPAAVAPIEAPTTAEEIFTGILAIKDLTISEKRAIIKDDIPDDVLRAKIAKELMTNAILTDNKEMLLTIDHADLNPVFAQQVERMEPIELMSGVELSEERKQALLVALDGAVVVETPKKKPQMPTDGENINAKVVEKEIKESMINNAAETITKSLFGDDYAERGNRLEDAKTIKEIVTLAVQDKALKDFQITDNEENIISAYIRDNCTKTTIMGFLTGGIQLKTLEQKDKARAVGEISKIITNEVLREKARDDLVAGNLAPTLTPTPRKVGREKGVERV